MKMRELASRFWLLLPSSALAAWLKMCDSRLFLLTWSDLLKRPLVAWIGSVLAAPLAELYYFWLAYLVGGIFFWWVSKLPFYQHLSPRHRVLLGGVNSAFIFLLLGSVFHFWSLQRGEVNLKLLLIYLITGGFYGWCSSLTASTQSMGSS